MNQTQLREKIMLKEQEIMKILERNKWESEYIELSNGETIKNNKMLNELKSYFNSGFFGLYTKDLRKEFPNENYNLYIYFSKNILEYYYNFLIILADLLNNYGLIEIPSEIRGIKSQVSSYGRSYAIRYKNEHHRTPLAELRKFNSPEYLESILLDKLEFFNYCDDNTIKEQLELKTQVLNNDLPKHFSNKKGYGSTIGQINRGFYSFEQKEILERFKHNGIKGIENITEVMDKEHLVYRLTLLHFIESYKETFKKDDFNLFMDKVGIITNILKKDYIEKHQIEPYYGLLELAKQYNEKKRKKYNEHEYNKYNLVKQARVIYVDDSIQEDMFNQLNKSEKKL